MKEENPNLVSNTKPKGLCFQQSTSSWNADLKAHTPILGDKLFNFGKQRHVAEFLKFLRPHPSSFWWTIRTEDKKWTWPQRIWRILSSTFQNPQNTWPLRSRFLSHKKRKGKIRGRRPRPKKTAINTAVWYWCVQLNCVTKRTILGVCTAYIYLSFWTLYEYS